MLYNCVPIMCVFVLSTCCEVRYDFRISSSLSPVGGLMPYLCYLCLFAHSGTRHILCCVFVFVFFTSCVPNVASFLRLSFFLIAPSVFSILSQEKFEDIKNIIRSRISMKNRQYNSISGKIEDRNNAFD